MSEINWYPGHMAKTKRLIKEKASLIDVVIEVVDARMPESSRIKDINHFVKNKPRIMILTKYDLCDKKITDKWIEYYRQEGLSVVPLDLTKNINKKKILDEVTLLMKEKNEQRARKGLKNKRSRILIVGIPNVGKSTLINRLVSRSATKTGNKPGVTKGLEWIRISDDYELLDSPGILWPKLDSDREALNLAALTAIKEDVLQVSSIAIFILEFLKEYYKESLEKRYNISVSEDVVQMLDDIGKRRGCLVKGGEVDYEKVYNIIVNDLKSGKINNVTFDRFTYEK